MKNPHQRLTLLSSTETLFPDKVQRLRQIEGLCVLAGVIAAVIQRGLVRITSVVHLELGLVVVLVMFWLSASVALRYYWCRVRQTFLQENRTAIVVSVIWCLGFVAILFFEPFLPEWDGWARSRTTAVIVLAEVLILARGIAGTTSLTRRAAQGGWNPALILVTTFAGLILVGTLLLMLPRSRSEFAPAEENLADRFRVALFTATSASCVTGLIVVPTGGETPYWSRMGQIVILGLFQIGGFGIMTCGAFFAVAVGRQLHVRESAALQDMLESGTFRDVRHLLFVILVFTLSCELTGTVLLSSLWPELPGAERTFQSFFHSVSAFCNAGFTLTDNSFVGMGTRWQIWGVVTTLIITGGLGFAVIYNLVLNATSHFRNVSGHPLFDLHPGRVRLTLTSKLVVLTTLGLLVTGTVGYFLLESTGPATKQPLTHRIAEAWFQSVTFRTAGFNTAEHAELQPATKLFTIALMFIGASPGSTGGGVKTVAFVLSGLALYSILRGRDHVEFMGRTIPNVQVNRALAIMSLGVMAVMTTTLLLVVFEDAPEHFIDHLFEATSAFATVGVSAGTTPELTSPSQFVIVATMFLGRVGPITLLLAMTGRSQDARYQFPVERVTLG